MEESHLKQVHTSHIPIRWCDMDAFGHVNNSTYFSYFEIARIDWWSKITPKDISHLETGPVVINANCTFFKPIVYPESINVSLFVGVGGRSSYECFYRITSATNESIVYAEGQTKVVWVDRKAEKSTPLPDYIRKHLPTA